MSNYTQNRTLITTTTMRSARRNGGSTPNKGFSARLNGRVTREDIRVAGLRRWNGRARITTDWVNLFHEPELCFPDGDVLVYLREPGQSSRGPAFRIHKAHLRARGFNRILEKCIDRKPLPGAKCMTTNCMGCAQHPPPSELYIPAPQCADVNAVFDHHITTRNYFAWMYDLPLAGRALGRSLMALKDRIDFYRPDTHTTTAEQVVAFAESQRYLDFRECADHALAALALAESLELEELWVDAFAHCVGLSHREIFTSIEYPAISINTRLLINTARLELEARLDRVSSSVANFFENDLSGNFLGLPQPAREHFDRFRSWLHSYYIEQHGFWPPAGLSEDTAQSSIYATMYSDFRNLYHHLVDPTSTNSMQDSVLAGTGGVCVIQNVQAFDARHKLEPLPKPFPMLPTEPSQSLRSRSKSRRQIWNPLAKRRMERDSKVALRTKALITASNRDWQVMDCLLVRRYSEFEAQSISDDFENITMIDGRKIRWILVYAILQTLVSVMQAPKQVRNTEGLTYSLCCHAPKIMPWQTPAPPTSISESRRHSRIEPDLDFVHSNISGELLGPKPNKVMPKNERRQSIPTRTNSIASRTSSLSHTSSIRDFISRRKSGASEIPPVPKPSAFCEILVEGYGNGLNEVNIVSTPSRRTTSSGSNDSDETPTASLSAITVLSEGQDTHDHEDPTDSSPVDKVPALTPTSSASVSRESSNASNSSSTWSKNSASTNSNSNSDIEVAKSNSGPSTQAKPLYTKLSMTRITDGEVLASPIDEGSTGLTKGLNQILDEHGFAQTLDFNTKAWDHLLANS